MPERVRFSPAPTGALHLGGAHTALFNHFVARRGGGTFTLRFEDTDPARSDRAVEAGIVRDLEWLGIRIDEGPVSGGPHAPYRQSERGAMYADALAHLAGSGRAYPCFCGPEELEHQRAQDASEGRAPRYRGPCRSIARAEADARRAAGEPHCWRFAVPEERAGIVVEDLVHGPVTFDPQEFGDFVLARSDGETLYDLACAVDDRDMGVTLVIRGDDHLPNTPRQLLLFDALGARPPRYAHLPLVRGADGRPLSKSRGSEAVEELRARGYLPSAVVNHLALLGWSDPEGREVLAPAELEESFDLARVSPAPSAHDPARLRWLNARHMSALPPGQRAESLRPFLPAVPGVGAAEAARLLADEVEVAGEVADLLTWVPRPLPPDEEARAALSDARAKDVLEAAAAAVPDGGDAVRAAVRATGVPAREAMPALRAALTGRAHGLPIATVLALLGAEAASARLAAVLTA